MRPDVENAYVYGSMDWKLTKLSLIMTFNKTISKKSKNRKFKLKTIFNIGNMKKRAKNTKPRKKKSKNNEKKFERNHKKLHC
jgi:hypothetical protein